MPKKTARRIIDTKKATGTTIISGVTVSGSPGSGASAAMAGDGLTYSSGVLNVGAGTGITVAADSVSLASTAAGAGLTHSSGVLAVGAGNGLTVNADDVALTTPGTLTAATSNSATGNHTHAVTTGAASTLTVATTNATGSSASLARADHLHTITTSSNPGAAAAILASTASGGLTLQSLAVQGSVDITNNGDLTVAGSGAYAGSSVLFVDSSGGNVGIMGAPDPQFALDVVGPCRATWFVGPHAIQLKDVLLLSHFDGRQPFTTNYAGEPNGHMGQVATVSGGVIYRPGKFGTKAAQFGSALTNYITNPSFETGVSGWSSWASATLDQTTVDAYIGTYAMRITHVASTTSGAYAVHSTSVASTYTASAYVRAYTGTDIGDNISIAMRFTYTDASTTDTTYNHTITNQWQRISVTATTNGAKTLSSITVYLRDLLSGPAHYTLVDAVQLEESSFAGPYCDGSLGSGHTWSGTAHASTSVRTVAQLTYPTSGNIHDEVGTVMAWVYVYRSGGVQTIMRISGTSAGAIYMLVSSGQLSGYWGTGEVTNAAGAITANTWTHVAMTYSGGTLTLYVNGTQVATGSSSGFSGMPATINVGGLAGSNMLHGLIDDFVITESVLDADGIRAVYESDAPVFAESSRFSFRATPQGLVWADDEGLWMRNSTGGTVLGAYGGASTKSWAGLTLDPSDVVVGDSARGAYMLWDDSAGTLRLGKTGSSTTSLYLSGTDLSFRVNATERVSLTGAGVLSIKDSGGAAVFTFDASAGAEFTKPLTIGTSGGIYQGTGTFASPTTGLKIWNDSGVGRIGGYNSGTLQWYASTTGYFYSGSGTMRIGSDDIRMNLATYDGDYDDYRTIKWVPTIDGSDTGRTDFNYRSDITSWASASDNVTLSLSTRVNAAHYNSRNATMVLASNNWNGTALNQTSIYIVQENSTTSYNSYIGLFSKYLYVTRNSAPSGTPSAGYCFIWVDSSTNTLKMKDSGGTTRSVTFS